MPVTLSLSALGIGHDLVHILGDGVTLFTFGHNVVGCLVLVRVDFRKWFGWGVALKFGSLRISED